MQVVIIIRRIFLLSAGVTLVERVGMFLSTTSAIGMISNIQ